MVKKSMISKYQYVMINQKKRPFSKMLKNSVLQLLKQLIKNLWQMMFQSMAFSNNDSKYINTSIPTGEVVVSSAMMNKFGLKVGDEVTLKKIYR